MDGATATGAVTTAAMAATGAGAAAKVIDEVLSSIGVRPPSGGAGVHSWSKGEGADAGGAEGAGGADPK